VRNQIIADGGSVQKISALPDKIRDVYKTVWEIPQRVVLDMAADRGAYICQSQSMNVHIGEPNTGKLTSMHFYAWKKGLKTGMYYLRTRPKADAIQFTVDQEMLTKATEVDEREVEMQGRPKHSRESPVSEVSNSRSISVVGSKFGELRMEDDEGACFICAS